MSRESLAWLIALAWAILGIVCCSSGYCTDRNLSIINYSEEPAACYEQESKIPELMAIGLKIAGGFNPVHAPGIDVLILTHTTDCPVSAVDDLSN